MHLKDLDSENFCSIVYVLLAKSFMPSRL